MLHGGGRLTTVPTGTQRGGSRGVAWGPPPRVCPWIWERARVSPRAVCRAHGATASLEAPHLLLGLHSGPDGSRTMRSGSVFYAVSKVGRDVGVSTL